MPTFNEFQSARTRTRKFGFFFLFELSLKMWVWLSIKLKHSSRLSQTAYSHLYDWVVQWISIGVLGGEGENPQRSLIAYACWVRVELISTEVDSHILWVNQFRRFARHWSLFPKSINLQRHLIIETALRCIKISKRGITIDSRLIQPNSVSSPVCKSFSEN